MNPSTRRRATVLMWLILALLPMRGWAMGVMALSTLPSGTPTAQAAHGAQAAVPACHEAAHSDTSTDTDTDDAAHAHALCNVCHAAAAPAPTPVMPAAQSPGDAVIGWARE